MRYRWLVLALIVGALAFVAAGCGGGDDGGGTAEGSEDVTGTISIMAIWGGEEQAVVPGGDRRLQGAVSERDRQVHSGGDNLAPLLSTAVEGGNPPDIACIGQPGLMKGFAEQGAIQPIDDLRDGDRRQLRRVGRGRRRGRRHAVRGHVQGREQVDHLVQRRRLRGGGRRRRRRPGTS